jgi:hypothetical protein
MKTYKRTEGGGDGESGGQLGGSKELSADDEEASLHRLLCTLLDHGSCSHCPYRHGPAVQHPPSQPLDVSFRANSISVVVFGAQVQKAAEAALKHLSSQSNSLFPYKLQEVRSRRHWQPQPLTAACSCLCQVARLSVTGQAHKLVPNELLVPASNRL